jgi:hypothetical protein
VVVSYSTNDTVTAMNNNGFIVLHRSLLDWEWYTDEKVSRLFIHCLLKANHADKKFRGKMIERGSFQTSYQMLSDETGLSVRSIRTSLNKLKTTGELTLKTTSKNTVIVLNNYDLYQSNDKQSDKRATNKRQTNDKQVTTNNNDNNVNNENNIKEVSTPTTSKNKYGHMVTMTEEEYNKLVDRYGKQRADDYIETVDLYCMSKNKQYKSYYAAVINFIKGDEKRIKEKQGDKMTYAWQEELKAEQQEADAREYEPKRDANTVKDLFNKL